MVFPAEAAAARGGGGGGNGDPEEDRREEEALALATRPSASRSSSVASTRRLDAGEAAQPFQVLCSRRRTLATALCGMLPVILLVHEDVACVERAAVLLPCERSADGVRTTSADVLVPVDA